MKTPILITTVIFLNALPVRSATLTIISTFPFRDISARAYASDSGDIPPTHTFAGPGLFDSSVTAATQGYNGTANGIANQNTFLSATDTLLQFDGSGHARATGTLVAPDNKINYAWASSRTDFQFTVDAPFTFSLSADTLTSGNSSESACYIYVALVQNTAAGNVPIAVYGSSEGRFTGPASGSTQGVLDPGTYEFTADAMASGGGLSATYDFRSEFNSVALSVQSVPEPSSALLLIAGAAFCLRRRTLRTHERSA